MGENGVVTAELDGNMLKVRFRRSEACSHCNACSTGSSSEEMVVEAYNDCLAKTGDTVNIEIKSEFFLKAVFIMYFVPLVFMFVGFGGGYQLALMYANPYKELIAFGAGLLFTGLAYLIIFKNQNRLNLKKFVPTATEVVTDVKPSL